SSAATNCYDIQLNPQFKMVGHAGKLVQSKKDPSNRNPYLDQIDVRGIWIDKLMALRYLTSRETGNFSFDRNLDNFLDIADLAPAIDQRLRQILLNQVVAPVDIHTISGQKLTVNYPVSFFDDVSGRNGHIIQKPLDP